MTKYEFHFLDLISFRTLIEDKMFEMNEIMEKYHHAKQLFDSYQKLVDKINKNLENEEVK